MGKHISESTSQQISYAEKSNKNNKSIIELESSHSDLRSKRTSRDISFDIEIGHNHNDDKNDIEDLNKMNTPFSIKKLAYLFLENSCT